MKYAQLFKYLKEKVNFRKQKETVHWNCDGHLTFTEQFCKENNLPKDRVIARCEKTGGFCDCEVLFNSTDNIDEEEEM